MTGNAARTHRDPYAAALRLIEDAPALATARAIERMSADPEGDATRRAEPPHGPHATDHAPEGHATHDGPARAARARADARPTADPLDALLAVTLLAIPAAALADAIAATGQADPAALVAYLLAALALGVAVTPEPERRRALGIATGTATGRTRRRPRPATARAARPTAGGMVRNA